MNKEEKNKAFMLEYYNALVGKEKPEALIRQFVADEKLIEHILFFEKSFPNYDLVPEEMFTKDDRVFVRAKVTGRHEGEIDGLPPTFKIFEMPFAICYRIEQDKIVDHWMIADQLELLEQLGLAGTIKEKWNNPK